MSLQWSVFLLELYGIWFLQNHGMKAAGLKKEDVEGGAGASIYITAFVCQLVMAFVLSGLIFKISPMLGSAGFSVTAGMIVAFMIWIGFIIPTQIVNNLFQLKPFFLTLIDGGHWLGVLLIQGIVIGLIGSL